MVNSFCPFPKITLNIPMKTALLILQLIISVLMTLFILVQNKEGGLSAAMGGGESFQPTRRGPEKILFNATVVLAVLFVANSLALALV